MKKLEPHDIASEEATLGAMLCAPSTIPVVLDHCGPSDFYRPSHADVFHAIIDAWNGDPESVDVVTIGSVLPQHRDLIHHLAEMVPVASNASHYAETVKHLSICRSLVKVGQQITDIGYEDGDDATSLMDKAEGLVFALRPDSESDTKRAKEIAHLIIHEVNSGQRPKAVSTGYPQIDATSGGFYGGNFIIIGARPGVGKSMCALNVAHRISKEGTVMFFSLEMGQKELAERLLCSLARVPVTHLRKRDLNPDELASVVTAAGELEHYDLRIVDNPSLSVLALKSKARQFAAKTDLRAIFVDYLQLMTLGRKTDTRFNEVSAMSRELKLLARDLNIPVIALSQLNRESQFGDGGKPKISQLRESGSLEQDADQVWLLRWEKNEFGDKDALTIDVAKNRSGSMGEVLLPWEPRYQVLEG